MLSAKHFSPYFIYKNTFSRFCPLNFATTSSSWNYGWHFKVSPHRQGFFFSALLSSSEGKVFHELWLRFEREKFIYADASGITFRIITISVIQMLMRWIEKWDWRRSCFRANEIVESLSLAKRLEAILGKCIFKDRFRFNVVLRCLCFLISWRVIEKKLSRQQVILWTHPLIINR